MFGPHDQIMPADVQGRCTINMLCIPWQLRPCPTAWLIRCATAIHLPAVAGYPADAAASARQCAASSSPADAAVLGAANERSRCLRPTACAAQPAACAESRRLQHWPQYSSATRPAQPAPNCATTWGGPLAHGHTCASAQPAHCSEPRQPCNWRHTPAASFAHPSSNCPAGCRVALAFRHGAQPNQLTGRCAPFPMPCIATHSAHRICCEASSCLELFTNLPFNPHALQACRCKARCPHKAVQSSSACLPWSPRPSPCPAVRHPHLSSAACPP